MSVRRPMRSSPLCVYIADRCTISLSSLSVRSELPGRIQTNAAPAFLAARISDDKSLLRLSAPDSGVV